MAILKLALMVEKVLDRLLPLTLKVKQSFKLKDSYQEEEVGLLILVLQVRELQRLLQTATS
jgi:hypothetical protein